DDGKALLVLALVGVEQFGEVVPTALPIRPDQRHRPRVVLCELGALGQHLGDPVRMGPVLDCDHLARVVPGWRGHDRRPAGGRTREEEALHHRNGRYSLSSQSVVHRLYRSHSARFTVTKPSMYAGPYASTRSVSASRADRKSTRLNSSHVKIS